MKKSLVEVNYNKLNEDSIIIYQHGQWVAIPKVVFLDGITKKINELDSKIEEEKNERIEENDLLRKEVEDLKNKLKIVLGEDEDEESE